MLISNAWAQAAPAAGGDPTGGLMGMLPIILMFVVLYFLMIRPQMKRAKEHKAMIEALQKGDEVRHRRRHRRPHHQGRRDLHQRSRSRRERRDPVQKAADPDAAAQGHASKSLVNLSALAQPRGFASIARLSH